METKYSWLKSNIIWITAFLFILSACEKKENYTVLSGQFADSNNSTLMLVPVENYFPGLECKTALEVAKTDSIGNFVFKTDQIKSGYYQVIKNTYHVLNYDLYLEAGDSIHIKGSSWGEKPELLISGRGSKKLNYLMADYQIFPMDKRFDELIESNRFETEFAFRHFIDSIQNARIGKLAADMSTPENLKSQFEKDINAQSASLLLNHLERRNYIMSEKFNYYYPDPSYYSSINKLNFDNEFCQSTAFKLFASDYLTDLARQAFKEKNDSLWWVENLNWKWNYISTQPKSLWTDFLALSTIKEYSFGLMQPTFFKNLKIFTEKMEPQYFVENDRMLFNGNAASYIALSPGMPAPIIELPDSSGNIVRLSDFKGKVVYIDFWGTWCYPCIQEIPRALELQLKYKGKPVVFLYVALEYNEKNIAEWKQFIAGKNTRFAEFLNKPFPGVHVVAEKQFRNENIKPYKINFAPTHVLVDQNGNIVNARDDGSKGIIKQIDQLLEGKTIQ